MGLQEIDECRERHAPFAGLDDHRVGKRIALQQADLQTVDEFGMPRADSLPVPCAGHRCRVHPPMITRSGERVKERRVEEQAGHGA
ncbi:MULTISPECIES: hypothetical protein [Gordonia]|uniref:hypothetical protein n=1 Tax=Gordonia TaxID=2053 RepID=UPI00042A5029|nr:hypothetical protein [Gordonia alkanivorans]